MNMGFRLAVSGGAENEKSQFDGMKARNNYGDIYF